MISGWKGLRFSQIIEKCKQDWATSMPKYGDFWDARAILKKISTQRTDVLNFAQVQNRCIVVMRLLHLCRSIDLARSFRKMSKFQGNCYFWLRRKVYKRPRWEPLMSLPDWPEISPQRLLLHYVSLTAQAGQPSGKIFLSLNAPFTPLSSSSIGRITKKVLREMGVPMSVFGAHSTRGKNV